VVDCQPIGNELFLAFAADGVTKARLGQLVLLLHQPFVFVIIYDGSASTDTGLAVNESPREEAYGRALVEEKIDVAADAFRMDYCVGKHLDVHELVHVVREVFAEFLAVLLLKVCVSFFRLPGHPVANDRVHWVVGAAAVDADPSDLPSPSPFGEFSVRAWVLDHIANLVGGWLIPTVSMVAGVDDQYVAISYFDSVLNHLGRVDVVVASGVRQVNHRSGTYQEIHRQAGNVSSRCVEMDLTVKVSSNVIRSCYDLPIRAVRGESLEVLHLERLVSRPRRGRYSNRNRQIDEFQHKDLQLPESGVTSSGHEIYALPTAVLGIQLCQSAG